MLPVCPVVPVVVVAVPVVLVCPAAPVVVDCGVMFAATNASVANGWCNDEVGGEDGAADCLQ